jgi:hypothetical protein
LAAAVILASAATAETFEKAGKAVTGKRSSGAATGTQSNRAGKGPKITSTSHPQQGAARQPAPAPKVGRTPPGKPSSSAAAHPTSPNSHGKPPVRGSS